MKKHHLPSTDIVLPEGADLTEEQTKADNTAPSYRPPQLFVIGKAVDLVQGSGSGKYSDGYTGYSWER
jgi:hypothetical protein